MSIFSIGLSGLSAAQSALSTTSNNLSNVYTEGYNRQLTILGESYSNGSTGTGVSPYSMVRTTSSSQRRHQRSTSTPSPRAPEARCGSRSRTTRSP